MNKLKRQNYQELVKQRKGCFVCAGLVNPSTIAYDSDEIGPWTRLQGNLDADILVVGQDWGDIHYFNRNAGIDNDNESTCKNLMKRFMEIGIDIGTPSNLKSAHVFLTNSILCLKTHGKSSNVLSEWQSNCCSKYLKSLISIIKPKVVVTLGEKAYRATMRLYGKKPKPFKVAVDNSDPVELEDGTYLFHVYHSSQRMINTGVRSEEEQKKDWAKIISYL